MVDDARSRTKTWLETYLTASNLTKDDNTTQVSYVIAYGWPDYPLLKVFLPTDDGGKAVDLVFSIQDPQSTPLPDSDHYVYGYEESVPIMTCCIDKSGITGTKLRWKASAELRRISETYPLGSLRNFEAEKPKQQNLGTTVLYQQELTLSYRRDTT